MVTHRALFILGAALLFSACLDAQGLVARASSVTGRVLLTTTNGASPVLLAPGYELGPGETVDTRGGGRVVIELTDGSMIVVQPESVIVIKDFRAAASLRELFEILVGGTRVRINHFSGRPNPYRINSPTASIAVRGTDFSITVDSRGDTQVMVYEGVVEVTSLADPTQSVVIDAGRGVLLVPGQGFQVFNAISGREVADQNEGKGRDWDSPRNIASAYEQYIAGLSDTGQIPFLMRYNAVPEAHLDSLENPAYATGFKTAEARLVVLPSLNGSGGLDEEPSPPGLSGVNTLNYSAAIQFSGFVPLGTGFVVGGDVAGSRVSNGVQGAPSDLDLASILDQTVPDANLQTNGSSTGNFFSGSLLVARHFGANTSFGVAIDNLRGTGALGAQVLSTEPLNGSIERTDFSSSISQRRITAGFERDLPLGQKLGVFYRYAWISAGENGTSHSLNDVPEPLDFTRSAGHSSEFGLRLRGPVGGRFFYGVAASWLGVSLGDDLRRAITVDSHQRDRAQRGSAALGFGYLLNGRTVLNLDFAGGTSRATTGRVVNDNGQLLQTGRQSSGFVSANVGIQTKLFSHLFLNSWVLAIGQTSNLRQAAYPDSLGNTQLLTDTFLPLTATGYTPPRLSCGFGAGWQFSKGLFVQYVFSTPYAADSGVHTVMLSFTFRLRRE